MTSLAYTSLQFCRVCLGWDRPVDRKFSEQNRNCTGDAGSKAWSPYIFDYHGRHDQFQYTDLSKVTASVRNWCDEHDASVEVGYYGHIPGEWEVNVVTFASVESITSDDLCHALLAACVEAGRKLKSLTPSPTPPTP